MKLYYEQQLSFYRRTVGETRGKVDISVSSDNGPANSCTEIQYAQSGNIAGLFNIEMVAFLSLGIKLQKGCETIARYREPV